MTMEKMLANGMTITYLDESKRLAADRWLVKLRCRITLPEPEWMREALQGDDPPTVFCRRQFAGRLCHEVVQERNFIDQQEREELLAEMVARFESTVLDYVQKEAFVRQLFAVRLAEFTEAYARQARVVPPDDDDDTPGPADFSDCFR